MECVQKQQSTVCVETPTPTRIKAQTTSIQPDVYDKASADFRRHLAYEQAISQLEHWKALSGAVAYRMSFIR